MQRQTKPYLVGIDIGGTFTDCAVVRADGEIFIGKSATTPHDLTEGFFGALEDVAQRLGLSASQLLGQTERLVHGTTQGTNALVARSGARVGLIATKGHGEAILVMNGGGRTAGLSVESMLDLPATDKPEPLVPRSRIVEVTERVDVAGQVIVPLDLAEAERAIQSLLDDKVEAIGICFLWSFLHPAHELAVKDLVRRLAPGVHVTASCELAPQPGEYPRMATVAMNAYTGPILSRYIERLEARVAQAGLARGVLFGQCSGAVLTSAVAKAAPILTLQSGPATGVAGTAYLGPVMGYPNVVTADMGGTTFDVGLVVDGQALMQEGTVFEQYELHLPMIDVQSVGAGGGSIAWVDEISGTLKVGPKSAGASPGPVCYGQGGTAPTVTDADLVMGVLDPLNFLGGRVKLDAAAAHAAVGKIAERLGVDVYRAAAGISQIVDSRMADLIRRMTLYKGYDPRDFVLFAFGGGGPTHAGLYADELGIGKVVVPLAEASSVWSALGAACCDLSHLLKHPEQLGEPFDVARLNALFAGLEAEARRRLDADGVAAADQAVRRFIQMKFTAQVFELEVELPPGELAAAQATHLGDQFIKAYEQRYGKGTAYRKAGIWITGLRMRAIGRSLKPRLARRRLGARSPAAAARKPGRGVYWQESGRMENTPIYLGTALIPGNEVAGPAVIEFPSATIVVRPRQHANMDEFGNIILNL